MLPITTKYPTEKTISKIPIGIVDDQQLYLRSLHILINSFGDFDLVAEAVNGEDLLSKLDGVAVLPEIILLDVDMPIMDGRATAAAITKRYPGIRLVALSMKDDDCTIFSMFKAGCCAYLLKDIHPDELQQALCEVQVNGYYKEALPFLQEAAGDWH